MSWGTGTSMAVRPTPRLGVHALLAVVGLVAAVLLRAPVLIVLASPSILLLAIDLTWRPDPAVAAEVRVGAVRLPEGAATDLTLLVTADARTTVEATIVTSGPIVPGKPPSWTLSLSPALPAEVSVAVTAPRWGAAIVGPVQLRWTSPGRMFEAGRSVGERQSIRVLPMPAAASQLVRPSRSHLASGNRTAATRGAGTEFAELRPFAPGDRARDINPRVSARRGSPWVAERHPELRTDVVLLLDAYDADQLGQVLQAALGLAQGYLAERDRVGVTSLGGVMRWVEPGSGLRQEHRIADALLDSRVSQSFVAPAVANLPPRALPPGALVLGLTPGTDRRLANAAVGLRSQGRDVAVVVLEPPPTPTDDDVARLTDRLLRLERRAARDRLHAHGVAAVAWDPATSVDGALSELQRWRRRQPVRNR